MAIFSNNLAVIRQRVSRLVDDLVLVTVSKTGAITSMTFGTTDPPQFYGKADDYFNDAYEAYCYEGTNIGVSRAVTDWVNADHLLTVSPAAGSAYDATSKIELHRTFSSGELLNAINLAIEAAAGKYLLDLKDETSISLVESTGNDDTTIYTYEYTLPTSFLFLHRVVTEGAVSGKKLTGTIDSAFTLGEKVTGVTSGATGILTYGPSTASYILVREVSGTFAAVEDVKGTSATCAALSAVADETVGTGKFNNEVDPRSWRIIKSYSPQIKFDKNTYNVVADLRIRLEGQGSQAKVSANIDGIYLPPEWVAWKAITFLPYSKIESNNLLNTFKMAEAKVARPLFTSVHPNARAVIE